MVYKLEDVAKPLPHSLSLLFRLHTECEIEKTIKQKDNENNNNNNDADKAA